MSEIYQNNRTSFFAGQSEDDSIGPEGTYNYGENLEVKRFSKFVELAKAPINSISHLDTTSTLRLGVETPNPLGIDPIFFLGDDGVIIRSDTTIVYTETGNRNLRYHAFNLGDSFYFTASGGASSPMRLNKILHTNIDSSWGADVSEDILSGDPLELIEPGSSGYHRFLVVGTIVYISSGSKIAKFNHNTGLVEAQFDFFNSNIVGMTYGAGHIKVFLKNGLMYLWDGVNEEQPLDIIPLGERLENAISIGAIEYVIGGDLGGLAKFFILDGRRLVEVNSKQYSRLLGIDKFNVTTTGNFQNIASVDNQIFLVDRNEEIPGGTYRVSSYGNKINGLPKGYSVDNTKNTNGNEMGLLTFIFTAQGKLFFGYSNSLTDKGVDYIDLEQNSGPFVSEGFMLDKLFDGGDIIQVKKEEKLYGKCVIETGTSIEVLQSVNGGAFTACKIIDENTDLDNGVFTLSDQSFNKINYREVSYKVILRTTDSNVSPKWYGFKTKYSFTD